MHRLIPAVFLVALSVAGCAAMRPASPSVTAGAQPETPASNSGSGSQPQSQSQGAPAASPGQSADASVDGDAAKAPTDIQREPGTPASSATASSSSARSTPSGGNRPAKHTGTSAPNAVPAATSAAAPSKAPAAPTLDLADLEQRLRDTHAIGVFTKLSLKNQVDDLLNEFRAFYKGPNKHPTPALRQRYDLLLLKVLSLLQDSDPDLAAAISSSREAIWGILADPDKFAKI
jgi:hypothetical protein